MTIHSNAPTPMTTEIIQRKIKIPFSMLELCVFTMLEREGIPNKSGGALLARDRFRCSDLFSLPGYGSLDIGIITSIEV